MSLYFVTRDSPKKLHAYLFYIYIFFALPTTVQALRRPGDLLDDPFHSVDCSRIYCVGGWNTTRLT
jgi:hypothetical protein